MASTYQSSDAPDINPVNYEFPITAITGHPYLEHNALMALYNGEGSGVELFVKRVMIDELNSVQTDVPSNANIAKVTAAPTNGTLITPIKADSANSTLPSQVEVRTYSLCASPTVLRRCNLVANQNMNRANQAICCPGGGQNNLGLNVGALAHPGLRTSAMQGYVLNEGQGIVLTLEAVPFSQYVGVDVTFTTADGSTYMVSESVSPNGNANECLLSVFNGSGSGVVLTVRKVEMVLLGEDTQPWFSIEKIDGLRDGVDLTPVKSDSANANLPSQVLWRRNSMVMTQGSKAGAIIAKPAFRCGIPNPLGVGPSIASLGFPHHNVNWIKNSEGYICLREGEGLAVIRKNASGLGKWGVFMEVYTATTGGSPSGGPVAYAYVA